MDVAREAAVSIIERIRNCLRDKFFKDFIGTGLLFDAFRDNIRP